MDFSEREIDDGQPPPPASSPGADKKFQASHYMKGLHEVVRHIIGAQRGVGSMPQAHNSLRLFVAMHYFM
jgi:hypothetical protein